MLAAVCPAQEPEDPQMFPTQWHGGYARDIGGAILAYDSALPEVGSALLVRSREAERSIAWETEPLPRDLDTERVTFVWLFGIDANPDRHRFDLVVDGASWLTFHNPLRTSLDSWKVRADNGAVLELRPTRIDRYGDLFGFATLSVPRALLTPGRALSLQVRGEDAGSPVWYMTFRAPPRAGARLVPVPAVLQENGQLRQPLVLEIVHLGDPTDAVITPSFTSELRRQLQLGLNRIELLHRVVTRAEDTRVTVRISGEVAHDLQLSVRPVRPWTIHLVQHTHTDIGYTRPQTEILPDHLRYIDYALDYCDLTDDYPDAARFRWTCEASWAVREYLRNRPPTQIERLRRRVEEGRIEVTALFANLSELLDERSCAASLEPLRTIRAARIPVATAMQNDVNGIAWCYADYLAELGVRYLNMGQHGHRALLPFEKPTAFWWESPSGKRLLAWRADHYMTGNTMGLHGGRVDTAEPAVFRYLADLEAKDYPFDRVAVQYSGVFLDNAPPGRAVCDLIRRWNERYRWPRLQSSTAVEFLRWVEREHGDELPVHRAAWPDWWSDGIGSAPREAAAARRTQAKLTAVEGLLAMDRLLGAELPAGLQDRVDAVRDRLVLYGEHTYGAAESIRDPQCENTVVQWAEKAAYVWEAVKDTALLEETAMGLLQPHLPRADVPTITIVNTLSWPRSGLHRVYIDHELLPPGRRSRIVDEGGDEIRAQPLSRMPDGSWWGLWVEDVPPLGFRTYRIEVGEEPPPEQSPPADALRLENRFYRLRLDPNTGAVASLFDVELQRELVDASAPHQLGQLVYEALTDRAQLERFTLTGCEREVATVSKIEAGACGPVFRSVVVTGQTPLSPGPRGFRLEIRLFETGKRIELHYRVDKRRSYDPEALYAAFPFALPPAAMRYETIGGVADPTSDLLPGTATDWQAVHGFVVLQNDAAQVALSSRDTLLAQLGGLNLGNFARVARIERPHVYGWLLNNYWVTNFRASAEGELRWSYALSSMDPGDPEFASRFGWNNIVPFLARVLPPAAVGAEPRAVSLLQLHPANVLLVGARPARDSGAVILQLREIAGRPAEVRVTRAGRAATLQRVSVLEDPLGDPGELVELSAGESASLRVLPRE